MSYGLAQKETGTNEQLADTIIEACKDGKARDIVSIDTSKHTDMFKTVVICSGISDRQVQGISNKIVEALQKIGEEPLSVEGLDKSHWVVIDCFDTIVHVFYEPTRVLYDLEGMWLKAPKKVIES